MIYFENEAAMLVVVPEKSLAVTKWKGFASSDALRELLEAALNLMDDHTIRFWLNDNRNMKVVRPSDQEYIVNEWLPRYLKKSQVQKSATIESEDIFSKMAVDSMHRKADHLIPFDSATFVTFQEATGWLGLELKEADLEKLAA